MSKEEKVEGWDYEKDTTEPLSKVDSTEQKADEESGYVEVVPDIQNIWLPSEPGETLIGEVIEIDEGQYGIFAIIQRDDGATIQTPAHKFLQSRIERVALHDKVKIEFTGTTKSQKGQNTRLYQLFKMRAEGGLKTAQGE